MKRLTISMSVLFVLASFRLVPTVVGRGQGIVLRSFFQAAAKGDIEQVQLLISQGVDVNAADNSSYTALHHAAAGGKMPGVSQRNLLFTLCCRMGALAQQADQEK